MKTVLFLIPSLLSGGAERVLVNLVNRIDKTKFRVSLQTLFDSGINREYIHDDVQYIPGFPILFRGNVTLMKLFTPRFLYKHIIKKRYDIVVSFLEGPTVRILAGCPYEDTKKVSWIHIEQHTVGCMAYSFRNYEEAKKCYRSFDKVVCVSQTVREDFMRLVPVDCEVIYNTNDCERIIKSGEEKVEDVCFSDGFNIVSVAKVEYTKGFDRLLSIHRRLQDCGIKNHVYIIGKGSEEKRLRKRAEELNVSDTFHFLGFKENPYKYVSKADLYVCSSRREGFSTAVTEALILGIPVVSTSCSGAVELLGGKNEYGIVTDNEEGALYDGIFKMLATDGTLGFYKQRAIERGRFFRETNTVAPVESMLASL